MSTEPGSSPRMNSLAVERTRHMSNSLSARPGFVFTLLYLIFEFGRPQDKIGQLSTIRLGLILISILVVLLFFNWRRLRIVASSQTSRSEEHTSELQSLTNLVCRLLLEKKKKRR